jgi:immune inhibitor A
MAQLYADYLRLPPGTQVSFKDYLTIIGFTDPGDQLGGGDAGAIARLDVVDGVQFIAVPQRPVKGDLNVVVLLVDFADNVGERGLHEYEDMLFSERTFPTGSLRDYYLQVSRNQVRVSGTVHGWFRMPQPYAFYVNNQKGTGRYPKNAQRLTEDALRAALDNGVVFGKELDALKTGSVTALIVVHAGQGAEVATSVAVQNRRIWSHKADLPEPVQVGQDLYATNYLTVPEDCRMGVVAHELGHLAFQWDDFYDPNYRDDGVAWAGSGNWDLMAGGSWNGDGNLPAHPAGLHKLQHGWVDIVEITRTTQGVRLMPYDAEVGQVVKVVAKGFSSTQCLVLENRRRGGFDRLIPGEGLLVWRVDTDKEQVKPDAPGMVLIQADGRREMNTPNHFNTGDSGDPFPGTSKVVELGDDGETSTSFPNAARSGIRLSNIAVGPLGEVTLDITIAGT